MSIATDTDENSFDYLVVGGGTAGCLLANRLSGTHEVALLEAGRKDDYHWVHVPVGYLYCISNPRTDWLYKTAPQAGLNGRSLIYPRGKVLGGCSSINGMIYMRGQAADYDAWASAGNRGWGWDECLPYFKQHENHHGGANAFHGASGEWAVNTQRLSWPVLNTFRTAANQYGIPNTADFNCGNNYGVGYFEVNQKNGWRWNTVKAFLHPKAEEDKLMIIMRCPVDKLLFDDATQPTRCTGVEVVQAGGERFKFVARRGVILSAGAVNTPGILERSGIGQPALLEKLGIPLRHALAGVGENLQDHLQIRTIFKVKGVKTLNTLASSLWGKLKIGLEYALRRTGPMSMAPSQLGAFAYSSAALASEGGTPNVQFHVQPLSLDAFGEPLHTFDALTVSVCNLRPTSRGSIHIHSADLNVAPTISPNYLSTAEDKAVAADSIRLARAVMAQAAMQPHAPQEHKPGAQLQTDAELISAAGDIGSTIFHPVGTCKMGAASDDMAVVSDRLAVHGLHALWIADASVMPNITSGNTNSPVLMIAERAAQWVLEAA